MTLTKKCWGKVNICVGGECGGVRADTWTDTMSMMLCEQLGCGNNSRTDSEESMVIIKSVHMLQKTDNLTKCNFVKYDNETRKVQKAANVVCSGNCF